MIGLLIFSISGSVLARLFLSKNVYIFYAVRFINMWLLVLNLLWVLLYFCSVLCEFSFFISTFISLSPLPLFLINLVKNWSKNQLLVPLIFSIVFCVWIAFSFCVCTYCRFVVTMRFWYSSLYYIYMGFRGAQRLKYICIHTLYVCVHTLVLGCRCLNFKCISIVWHLHSPLLMIAGCVITFVCRWFIFSVCLPLMVSFPFCNNII